MDSIDYIKLINYIKCLEEHYYNRVNNWNFNYNLNLKRIQVRQFLGNKELQLFTLDYILKFNSIIKKQVNFNINGVSFDYRIKIKNSVYSKIDRYNDSELKGKVPIIKCLNDLLGIRFIIEDTDCYNCVLNKVEENFKDKKHYKFIDSSKNGYKGYHLYIKIDNYMFPFEIQFWKKEDEKTNKNYHNIYKQSYTNIEKCMSKDEIKKEGVEDEV